MDEKFSPQLSDRLDVHVMDKHVRWTTRRDDAKKSRLHFTCFPLVVEYCAESSTCTNELLLGPYYGFVSIFITAFYRLSHRSAT